MADKIDMLADVIREQGDRQNRNFTVVFKKLDEVADTNKGTAVTLAEHDGRIKAVEGTVKAAKTGVWAVVMKVIAGVAMAVVGALAAIIGVKI